MCEEASEAQAGTQGDAAPASGSGPAVAADAADPADVPETRFEKARPVSQ